MPAGDHGGRTAPTDAAASSGAPVVVAVIIIAIVQLAGELDWNEIAAAVGLLQGWQLAVLLVCVGFRQFLNALPLTVYVDGIGPLRAMQNQQAAVLFTTVAPPPSGLLTWRIQTARQTEE